MAEKKTFLSLSKYTLLRELGRGAYGTVYLARDTVLEVERAVKVLHPVLLADPTLAERFHREAKLAARLEHPHIVPVYDFGEEEGRFYLAMRYMPGGSLKERLERDGALPWAEALRIARQVAEGLAYAHRQGVVHRDLKPGNILFDEQGNARVSDFGFAKAVSGGASSMSLTATGGMIGTPPYMAPELWSGGEIGPGVDQYALACIVVEMLTGKVLFDAQTPAEAVTQHLVKGPEFPEAWPEGVPEGVEEVLRKALAQEAEARYPDVMAFVEALEGLEAARGKPEAGSTVTIEAEVQSALQAGQWEEAWRGLQALREMMPDLAHQLGKEVIDGRIRDESRRLNALMHAGDVAAIEKVRDELRAWGGEIGYDADLTVWSEAIEAQLHTAIEQKAWQEAEQWLQLLREMSPASVVEAERWYWEARSLAAVQAKDWRLVAHAAEQLLRLEQATFLSVEPSEQNIDAADMPATAIEQPLTTEPARHAPPLAVSKADEALVKAWQGHEDGTLSVAFSPDGKFLASAGWDGAVRLWEIQTGRNVKTWNDGGAFSLLRLLWGDAQPISEVASCSVAFSPQGDLLAAGAENGAVRLWKMPDGELEDELGNEAEVWGLAFSPDGKLLVAGLEDGMVRVWRVSERAVLHTTLEGHTQSVWDVVFSPDGQFLASASSDRTVRVWRVWEGEIAQVLRDYEQEVNSVAFSPNGGLLASGSDDGVVRLWRMPAAGLTRSLEDEGAGVKSVSFSPDGTFLAAGCEDGIVRLWRVSDGVLTHLFEGHTDWVQSVAFSPDGQFLASGSEDGTIRLWRVP